MNPSTQFALIQNYNWDDGFELVMDVLQSRDCPLEVALLAFWRVEGPWAYLVSTRDETQMEFVHWLADRIVNGVYQSKLDGFDPQMSEGISASQILKLKKAGLPAVFLGTHSND